MAFFLFLIYIYYILKHIYLAATICSTLPIVNDKGIICEEIITDPAISRTRFVYFFIDLGLILRLYVRNQFSFDMNE